jgi:hypothetical protein
MKFKANLPPFCIWKSAENTYTSLVLLLSKDALKH